MTNLGLPPSHLAVLEAMTQPDPRPPTELDSPADAVCRRLPGITGIEAAEILGALNALGLADVPYVAGMVNPHTTANLARWITEEGWTALGMDPEPDGGREN